ncbi:hypothetical protein [Chitinophaga sp. SYP-B3965]|uniref:hypothetical protein n=1 Tax=Chitinophaga sp. SYP-B3965 TaxID=2663120 RepID=UPI0012997C06|nr:hypothetical protein [Chitinophaga sp. SYP-B3965]
MRCNYAEPQDCTVFKGEKLLYFFYGKASFLVNEDLSNYTDNPPLTLIYDSNAIDDKTLWRIMPFDSGGFHRYLARKGFERKNFGYTPGDRSKIIAYIRLIFNNNSQYLEDQISMEDLKKYEERCLEIQEMIKIFKDAKVNTGPQLYSIELQYQAKVSFTPTHLVIPYDLYTAPFWGKNFKLKYPDIKVEHYGQDEVLKSKGHPLEAFEYQRLMREKVKTIIKG